MKKILSNILAFLSIMFAYSQSSTTYVADRTHISIKGVNLYVENINSSNGYSIRILEASHIVAAGKKNTLGNNNIWEQSDNSTFKFIAYANNTENINQVNLAIYRNITLKNVSFLIPASSTFNHIVLAEEVDNELRVANSFNFPENHLLFLGQAPKTPVQSDINNVMNLKLEQNTLLNNGEQRYNSFIVTPGNSSLEQYVDHTQSNNLVIFPVGDNAAHFLPVGIYQAKKSAFFKVTASDLYYNWNLAFLNVQDKVQIDDIRKDYVKKTWNIRHNLVENVDAAVILQHPQDPNIQAADYLTTKNEEGDRTMISRYRSRDDSKFERKRHPIYGDTSISSKTFWENLSGSSETLAQLEGFGRENLVPPPLGKQALSHFAYISDLNPFNTYFMKVGYAEDSLPMGRIMTTPVWGEITATHGGLPGSSHENAITFTVEGASVYRIREVELRYTTDAEIGAAELPNDADPTKMKRQTIYYRSSNPNTVNSFRFDRQAFDAFNLEEPAFSNNEDIYYRFYPKGYFPYENNQTVKYTPSPVNILNPNIEGPSIVRNNIISIADEGAAVRAILPSVISQNIAEGTCYFLDPVSKNVVHQKILTKVGSNWQVEIPVSELVIAPLSVYLILIETKMLDGSKRNFHKKFILQ